MSPGNPDIQWLSVPRTWDNWGTTERSPSRVIGVPQLGLLATNQHYLKGA